MVIMLYPISLCYHAMVLRPKRAAQRVQVTGKLPRWIVRSARKEAQKPFRTK